MTHRSDFRLEIMKAIDDRRQERGLSWRQLSELVGISQASLSRYKSGQAAFSIERLATICAALDINFSQLFAKAEEFAPTTEPDPQASKSAPTDESPIAGPLRVYIDANVYSAEEKGELLSLISQLYRLQATDRLVIDHKGMASSVPAEVVNPIGG